MTVRRTTLGGHTFEFASLADLLARATPHRSGDVLAGCAAESAAERVAAQTVLADLPLATFLEEQVVGYEEDDVTRLILDTHDRTAFAPVASLTVGEFRDRLLAWAAAGDEPVEVALITAGDSRKRIIWSPEIMAAAMAAGSGIDHNGYLAPLDLLPPTTRSAVAGRMMQAAE